MKENKTAEFDALHEQFNAVHHRLEVLTDNFSRLPSQMSVEEQAELDALESEHSQLFKAVSLAAIQ